MWHSDSAGMCITSKYTKDGTLLFSRGITGITELLGCFCCENKVFSCHFVTFFTSTLNWRICTQPDLTTGLSPVSLFGSFLLLQWVFFFWLSYLLDDFATHLYWCFLHMDTKPEMQQSQLSGPIPIQFWPAESVYLFLRTNNIQNHF